MITIEKVNKGECNSCMVSSYEKDHPDLFELAVFISANSRLCVTLCRICTVKLRHELNWIL